MALQFSSPLVLGVMLVVAVGTFAYSWWNTKNQQDYTYAKSSNNFDSGYDTRQIIKNNNDARSRRRKDNKTCTICFEYLTGNDQKLPCNHSFHSNCIRLWLKDHNTCPNCRRTSSARL